MEITTSRLSRNMQFLKTAHGNSSMSPQVFVGFLTKIPNLENGWECFSGTKNEREIATKRSEHSQPQESAGRNAHENVSDSAVHLNFFKKKQRRSFGRNRRSETCQKVFGVEKGSRLCTTFCGCGSILGGSPQVQVLIARLIIEGSM